MEPEGVAGPKVARLLYFVGAGFICTVAINKWRDLQRKRLIQHQTDQLSPNIASPTNKASVE